MGTGISSRGPERWIFFCPSSRPRFVRCGRPREGSTSTETLPAHNRRDLASVRAGLRLRGALRLRAHDRDPADSRLGTGDDPPSWIPRRPNCSPPSTTRSGPSGGALLLRGATTVLWCPWSATRSPRSLPKASACRTELEHEFDMIIFAIGFGGETGAMPPSTSGVRWTDHREGVGGADPNRPRHRR